MQMASLQPDPYFFLAATGSLVALLVIVIVGFKEEFADVRTNAAGKAIQGILGCSVTSTAYFLFSVSKNQIIAEVDLSEDQLSFLYLVVSCVFFFFCLLVCFGRSQTIGRIGKGGVTTLSSESYSGGLSDGVLNH